MSDGKRRFLTPSGFKKVKRYLQRKYHETRKKDQINAKKAFSNSWAVQIEPTHKSTSYSEVAHRIAKKHGFENRGQIGNLKDHFHFVHNEVSKRDEIMSQDRTDRLETENEVKAAIQQEILDRYKRDITYIPNDPYFKDMWYLLNTGQASGPAGVDMNVVEVWKKNITGSGIVISVLDDGLDYTHPDLEKNYDRGASYDFNDNDEDPMPRDSDADNCHGTRCAGEAAAIANNGICGVGVSYDAKIGGVRMLDGQATDALEASALGHKGDHIDIYINCWGPKDDGKTFGKPGPMAAKALRNGAEKGRGNLGSIFVWATGNGGLTDDDCNCDGYTTSIFTISIGCIGDHGLSAYYTEKCSSTLAVTFNGASHKEGRENKMVTTDLYHQCTEEFKGTSASAPLAAGVIALTLQANPELTWRDIQALIVNTAQITSPVDDGWKRNGAGFHYNHKFGFGRLDANAMVEAARTWRSLGPQKKCTAASGFDHQDIPRGDSLFINVPTVACESSSAQIRKLEHVVVTVSFVHRRRGDVSIDLISPGGTRSQMLSPRRYDDSDEGLDEWNFMTVYNWGEDPKGMWRLKITDNPNQEQENMFGEDNDVEELEEQVIDAQAKMQKAKWDERRKKEAFFITPYPSNVRKETVPKGESEGDDRENPQQSTFGHWINARSDIPLNHDDSPSSGEADQPIESKDSANYVEYVVPSKRGNLEILDEQPNLEEGTEGQSAEISKEENLKRSTILDNPLDEADSYVEDVSDDDNHVLRKSGSFHHTFKRLAKYNKKRGKKDFVTDEEHAALQYFNEMKKALVAENEPFEFRNSKKVQVMKGNKEETGVPRVQVNVGYESPVITCVDEQKPCSGVLLKWVLTFYGTGPDASNFVQPQTYDPNGVPAVTANTVSPVPPFTGETVNPGAPLNQGNTVPVATMVSPGNIMSPGNIGASAGSVAPPYQTVVNNANNANNQNVQPNIINLIDSAG